MNPRQAVIFCVQLWALKNLTRKEDFEWEKPLQRSSRASACIFPLPTAGSALGRDTHSQDSSPAPQEGSGAQHRAARPPGSGAARRRGTPDSPNCGSLEGQGCFHVGISFGYQFLLEN